MPDSQFLSDIRLRKRIVMAFRKAVSKENPKCILAVQPSDIILATMVAYDLRIPLYYRTLAGNLNATSGLYGQSCVIIVERLDEINTYRPFIIEIKSSGGEVHKALCLVKPDAKTIQEMKELGVDCEVVTV